MKTQTRENFILICNDDSKASEIRKKFQNEKLNIEVITDQKQLDKLLERDFNIKNVKSANKKGEECNDKKPKAGKIKAEDKVFGGVAVHCELTWVRKQDGHRKPEYYRNTDFYGITLARNLRSVNKINLPFVFLSSLNLSDLIQPDYPYNDILVTIGHEFVNLPCQPENWIHVLKGMEPLDEMSLKDVIYCTCDAEGVIHNHIHDIQHLKNNIDHDTVIKKLAEHIIAMYTTANRPYNDTLKEFKENYPELSENNNKSACEFVAELGRRLVAEISEEKKDDASSAGSGKAKKDWKVLLLDDHPESEDIDRLKKALEKLVTEVIIVSNMEDARKKLDDDFKAGNFVSVVISDYRLDYEYKEGDRIVIRQQRKQG
jgi:hypothetical protein